MKTYDTIQMLRRLAFGATLLTATALLPACDVPVWYVQLWHDSSCPRRNAVEWICTASRRAETHVLRTVSRHGGHLPLSHRESRDEVVRIACNFVRAVLGS